MVHDSVKLGQIYIYFLKVFGGHMSFFGATGTPVLDSGDVSSGFQSQSGFPRDSPLVLHLPTSWSNINYNKRG